MKLLVNKSKIAGSVKIPGSKSHTIRALIIAGLSKGRSIIQEALLSGDIKSCIEVLKAFGANIEVNGTQILVEGFGENPKIPSDVIDVGNSGTTLNIALGVAGVLNGTTIFTGDHQIRKRPIENLIRSLNELGADCFTSRQNGCPPVVVKGSIKGGETNLQAITSQYLTCLLIACPLANENSKINVPILYEAPYVDMTLWWLNKQGIKYKNDGFKVFEIPGGQKYKAFNERIPGDFSSATFFATLAAISGGEIFLDNLDMTDPQGDKEVFDILTRMGAKVWVESSGVRVKGGVLEGIEIDMNAIPDALPAMAVVGCFAKGETKLLNVPQARLKETDRIKVMFEELTKMGADIEELEDGLIIRQSRLKSASVNGHHDHRIVMALAVAGMNVDGETLIDTAEAIKVTFPEFINYARDCGGNLNISEGQV